MPSLFYPSSVVLFQLHGGMVSHMQVLATHFSTVHNRAVASGPAGPTLVGPLFGSKMRECLDDSYARAHALSVAAVFHSVDRGMDSSFT